MIIQVLAYFIAQLVLVFVIYQLVISLFGLKRKNDRVSHKPTKTFALIIAAHNEETVVQYIVHSLQKLDYPKDMYDIFVIADNCSDKTAERGRNAGAIVFERFSDDKRGKGYAMEWMFEKIFKMEKKYDSIAIFDADNLASKGFLKEMNNKLCEGFKVVQGYLDSKNPKDSWITGSYSIAFWQTNRMFQLARSNIGLSSQLGGTGFCVDTEILRKLGWGATCLTEDLEFSCKLVLNGEKVGWAHDAIIYDEKPLTLKQSWNQRKRWMQGFADVASRYSLKLLIKGLKEKNWVVLDCALYSIQPYISIMMGISIIYNVYNYIYAIVNGSFIKVFNYKSDIFIASMFIVIFFNVMYIPIILILEKKINIKIIMYYIVYPIYSLTWIPISLQGILNKDKKVWSHTVHTRNVEISDIEKIN